MNDPLPPPLAAAIVELERLDGVARVYPDAERRTLHLVCTPAGDGRPVEALARALFVTLAGTAAYGLEFSYLAPPESPRRVRLCGVRVEPTVRGDGRATVELEWQGNRHQRTADVMGGAIGPIRAVGEATLAALTEIVDGRLGFHLTGAKTTRVFDEDIVLVLIHTGISPGTPLIGVASAGDSIAHAAARAVLGACNRLLGNYLDTTQ